MMFRTILALLCLILLCSLLSAQNLPDIEPVSQAASDSLSLVREREILSEYGFRDSNTLSEVASKLQIADIYNWKHLLGLEAGNRKLDEMSLRKLSITP